ncbi:MAG TPA: serine/threonine protein kinase, partial [Nannocystis exedens]|nr:serine/threonine protein kinase [Nannocystis exedens]
MMPASGGEPLSSVGDRTFPRSFGKYTLLREVARGGMGELFLALPCDRDRDRDDSLVVIKRILPGAAEIVALRTRFIDEARVMVRLHHANLVRVFDAGTIDGEHYLAMEFVHGQDLRALWNRCAELRRRIPIDLAIYVCCEVARGLAYAHDVMGLGLVHRDISPPNVLVGYDGRVKVTDFGLAKSTLGREITGPGMLMGRHSYLSPEQARGLEVDHRADIYALGVILWELLTGRQLLAASHRSPASALAAARNPNIRPPSELVAGIPEGLDRVVLEALVIERDRRCATAGRFCARLSEILSRHFPSYDAEPASLFIRELFAREYRLEVDEHNGYLQEDFSRIRGQAHGESMSISDDIDRPRKSMGPTDVPEQVMTPRQLAEKRRGTVIADRFRIEGLISFDGMGALYRARDRERGGPCQLRVLPESYTRDPELTSRFLRDTKEVSKLGHANIIRVLDVGRLEDGSVYSGMELLNGQSIATIIREEGKLSPGRAVHIATQVCRALATAHEHSLIHRDLKPESVVLVAQEGDLDFVKVVDFGICKQVDSEGSASSPGTIIGTPDYMAPEQAAGAEANVASDIYALGCILFEMLSATRPFSGRNSMDVLRQKGAGEAPRVDAIDGTIPSSHADVIAKCLARDPEQRPESMRHVELELMRAQELADRDRSESSGLSPLPPPPAAGTLLSPPIPAQAATPTTLPPMPTPLPRTPTPVPRMPTPQPTSPLSAPPSQPVVSESTGAPEVLTASGAKPMAAGISTSGLVKPFTEPDIAADRAGRSIIPIALFGAAAVAVVLFVWPGVLRDREPGPEPEKTSAGANHGPAGSSSSQGSGTQGPGTQGSSTQGTGSGSTGQGSAGSSTGADTSSGTTAGALPKPGEPDLVLLVGKLELAAA